MANAIRIGLVGGGRMGQAIAALAAKDESLALAGIAGRGDDIAKLASQADVIIDFSLPEATARVLDAVLLHNKPLVCGVSGLGVGQLDTLAKAAKQLPIVYDRNMSQGIAVLNESIRQVAPALGAGFAIKIEETHHRHKQDAPSGTALKLGETAAGALGIDKDSIRYQSHREGEVVGDHTIIFSSACEELKFSHSVNSRDVFAAGALRAAAWVFRRPPGQYSMHNVLFDV
jgi:4-hydroxy-tetrahydrodipicolinate reductase